MQLVVRALAWWVCVVLLSACNDVLAINPPSDELLAGDAGQEVHAIEGDDAGSDDGDDAGR